MIQGALEAYQFADQGVVSAMRPVSLAGQQLIEIEFRFGVMGKRGFDQSGFREPGACDADETRGYGMSVFPIVAQALLDVPGSRQVLESRLIVGIHEVQAGSLQKLSTVSRKLPGSSAG